MVQLQVVSSLALLSGLTDGFQCAGFIFLPFKQQKSAQKERIKLGLALNWLMKELVLA